MPKRSFRRAVNPVHSRVLPLDRERTAVADVVQRHDHFLKVHIAVARRSEVPVAPGVAKFHVSAEDPNAAVAVTPPGVLHVHVEDSTGKATDEGHIIDSLVAQVRGIEVESKPAVALDCGDRLLGAGDVEGDLGRVHLEPEVHVEPVIRVEDRPKPFREILESLVPISPRGRREGVDRMPDRGAGEPVDHRRMASLPGPGLGVKERAGRLAGPDHLLRGPAPNALGIAIAPDFGRQDRPVALVDEVAHGLADEMIGDGVAGQLVIRQQLPELPAVAGAGGRLIYVEVIPPAGQL